MRLRLLPPLLFLPAAVLGRGPAAGPALLVQPYLQLGGAPAADALSLLWHAPDQDADWALELTAGEGPARTLRPAWVRVAVPTVAPHRVYTAVLRPLAGPDGHPGALLHPPGHLRGQPHLPADRRPGRGTGPVHPGEMNSRQPSSAAARPASWAGSVVWKRLTSFHPWLTRW